MKILFTFTGEWDTADSETGPVMATHNKLKPELTVIFTTNENDGDKYYENAKSTRDKILAIGDSAVLRNLSISKPNNHNEILNKLRAFNSEYKSQHKEAEYFILLTPGTAQIHSCWLMLAASGEIPATLVQTNKPGEGTPVETVNHQSDEFPRIHVDFAHLDKVKPEGNGLTDYLSRKNIAGNQRLYRELNIEKIAKTGYPILIQGETGSGKENIATAIHDFSNRSTKKIKTVNCGAISATLAESELFGHVKGAFTGAVADRTGKIEEADGSTLFLDEIGDLSKDIQVKLLRVLQFKKFTKVGSNKVQDVDVRIVAASHKNLRQAVRDGKFREDLYYRLSGFTLGIPSLRERPKEEFEDIAVTLLELIGEKITDSTGGLFKKTLSPEALERLREYSFPGNIRELENILVKSCFNTDDEVILPDNIDLPDLDDDLIYANPLKGFDLKEWEKEMKRRIYQTAYEIGGSYANAGKILNVSLPGVRQFLKYNKL